MATYNFATMSLSEAFEIGLQDIVNVAGTASRTTVLFNDNGTYTVVADDRTLLFGLGFREVANASPAQWVYADGSRLHVGDLNPNSFNLTPNPNVVEGGAAYGGAGNDGFNSLRGNWLIQGNQGDDVIRLSGGSNTVYGGQDNDRVELNGQVGTGVASGQNFAQGNRGDDTLIGAGRSDTLLGGQGNDVVDGQGGQDFLNGNLGNDSITGNGQLLGEGGDDTIVGGAEPSNIIRGGDGDDQLSAGFVTVGGARRGAANVFYGDAGDDFIRSTSPAADTMFGGAGNDVLTSSGNDIGQVDELNGEDGDDVLLSQLSVDRLRGGAGADSLAAGEEADTLDGGSGADTLSGGAGNDVFVFLDPPASMTSSSLDRITDWSAADRIRLSFAGGSTYIEAPEQVGSFDAALAWATGTFVFGLHNVMAIQVGADVVVFVDNGGRNTADLGIVLAGRTLADISEDNFI